jgi:hypothetical protein
LGSNPILHLYLPGSRIVPARVKVPVFIWGDLPNFDDWGLVTGDWGLVTGDW